MRIIAALIRASWLGAVSYRVSMILSIAGLMLSAIPLYFVANALQPVMQSVIEGEGSHYFGFVLMGTVVFSFLPVCVRSLPTVVSGGIASGVLEALITTPARLPLVLAGMTAYNYLWALARAAVLVLVGALLGAQLHMGQLPGATLVLVLIVLAYIPVGMTSAALILAFRTPGPLAQGVLVASTLLGGVYYPTHVIPSWLEHLAAFVPLSYGLRALRGLLLEGVPFREVLPDVMLLSGFVVALFATATILLFCAVNHARRAGTLSQY